MTSINFDPSQINQQNNQSQNTEKTVFTKQQFTNSVMSALSNAGANSQQIQEFSQQANSIFDANDTNGDSKWSQQEANNGASALQGFYNAVNNAIKGIGKTQDANQVNATDGVTNSNPIQNIKTPTVQNINESAKMDELKQDLQDIQACGYQISMGSDGVIQLQGPNGETGSIKINDDCSIELKGCAQEALQKASDRADAREQQEAALSNMDAIEQKYSGQHGEAVDVKPEVKTVNGQEQKVGVMTFQDGTEVMFDLKTGKEIEA